MWIRSAWSDARSARERASRLPTGRRRRARPVEGPGPDTGGAIPFPKLIDPTEGRFNQHPPQRPSPAHPLVTPVRVPLLAFNPRRLHVPRLGLRPLTAQTPCSQAIPHLPPPDEPGVPRLRIAPPPPPIAPRIGIGPQGSGHPSQHSRFTSSLPQIFQAPPAGLEHQNQPIHDHRRRLAAVAAWTGQLPIRHPAAAPPLSELGPQGPAPRGRQRLIRPCQLEGHHAVASPQFTLSVNGCGGPRIRYSRL